VRCVHAADALCQLLPVLYATMIITLLPFIDYYATRFFSYARHYCCASVIAAAFSRRQRYAMSRHASATICLFADI